MIVSINTLHEFAHRKRMIEAMGRVLKRGGRVLTVDFKKVETGFGPPVSIRVSEVQATKLFEEKGFASVTKQDYPYLRVLSKRKV